MSEVISLIKNEDPEATLVCARDVICENCPNDREGTCSSEQKVQSYDRKLLAAAGLAEGERMPASEFISRVRGGVIAEDRLGEICSDCCWYEICSGGKYDI